MIDVYKSLLERCDEKITYFEQLLHDSRQTHRALETKKLSGDYLNSNDYNQLISIPRDTPVIEKYRDHWLTMRAELLKRLEEAGVVPRKR